MGLFSKPTLAQIYINELRTRLDGTWVPLFAPDLDVAVGTIGSFDDGQFMTSGATIEDDFAVHIPTRSDRTPTDWAFASEGAVELTPGATVTIGGVELLTGKLAFNRKRSVVASFKGLTATTGVWTSELNRAVWELYLTEQLPPSSVVVCAARRAASGTVVVSRKGGMSVDLAADPQLLGGLLSLQGLGAGVTFTGGSQASVQLSGPDLTPFVRVKGITPDWSSLADVKRFEGDPEAAVAELASSPVPDVDVDLVIGQADWDAPENGT